MGVREHHREAHTARRRESSCQNGRTDSGTIVMFDDGLDYCAGVPTPVAGHSLHRPTANGPFLREALVLVDHGHRKPMHEEGMRKRGEFPSASTTQLRRADQPLTRIGLLLSARPSSFLGSS